MGVLQLEPILPVPEVRQARHTLVEVRDTWSGEWQPFFWLRPVTASLMTAPAINNAILEYEFGNIKREDRLVFEQHFDAKLIGKFVRISLLSTEKGETVNTPVFHGIIESQDTLLHGNTAEAVKPGPSGNQRLVAYGLEQILDRSAVLDSFAVRTSDSVQLLRNWSPPFNERFVWGTSEIGNRTNTKQTFKGRQIHFFSEDRAAWNHRDIVEYLLATSVFTDVPFVLGGQAELLETMITPRFNVEGSTVRDLLMRLIPSGRGLGWTTRIDKDDNVTVHVYSVFGEDSTVGDIVLQPNQEKVTLELDDRNDVSLTISEDAAARYDKVFVRGARIKSMFTMSFADATLIEGWATVTEFDYKTPPGSTPGDLAGKDRDRTRDSLDAVYTRFVVPRNFDWQVGDGKGGAKRSALHFPNPDGSFREDERPLLNDFDHRLMRDLFLLQAGQSTDSDVEFRPLLVLLKDPTSGDFLPAERLTNAKKSTALVRPLDNWLGVEVRMPVAHQLAKGHFDPEIDESEIETEIDYLTMVVTGVVETDARLQVEETLGPALNPDIERILHIDLPDAERWWLVQGTVTDVENGKLVNFSGDSLVRDDVERLRAMAAFAKAWYGQPRRRVTIRHKDLRPLAQVGNFLVSVSQVLEQNQVGTCVTSLVYDFLLQETEINTDFAIMEFVGL